MKKKTKAKRSANGFYCADCRKFVYMGYDRRDKDFGDDDNARCESCGEGYPDRDTGEV